MSGEYAFDYPTGREVHPDPPTWAFGVDFMTATDEAVAICRDASFRELTEDEIDFAMTNRKRLLVKGEAEYFRYHQGSLESATDAGVSAFYVLAPGGSLVLLARPGSEKVVTERLDDLPRGYEASPDLKIRQPWMPGLEPARPHR
jgi:hypothetical protein